jgi:hypothetical protein
MLFLVAACRAHWRVLFLGLFLRCVSLTGVLFPGVLLAPRGTALSAVVLLAGSTGEKRMAGKDGQEGK